jgi:hypothetical protein
MALTSVERIYAGALACQRSISSVVSLSVCTLHTVAVPRMHFVSVCCIQHSSHGRDALPAHGNTVAYNVIHTGLTCSRSG